MQHEIRDIHEDEVPLLEEFLYRAIFVPADFQGEVPRSIIGDDPHLAAAIEGFGTLPDDRAVVAVVAGAVVGSCWARTTNEYGHIDEATPSLSLSLLEDFRGQGLGTELLQRMIDELFWAGYARVSLSVQKNNPALHLYQRMGFCIVGNGADATEWLMVRGLNELFTVIETERLVLRPWLASDARTLFALASDPDVGPAAGWPAHESQAMSAEIIRTVLAAPEMYAVVLKSTGDVVGCAGMLFGNDANVQLGGNEAELGYWSGKPHWGFGYATEAARAVVERGFGHLGLHAVWAAYYDGNDRSRRVLDKLGFSHVCTMHDVPCSLLGDIRTEHHMRLLRCDDCGYVRLARAAEVKSIHELVRGTICDVYPLYYPQAVVNWFCQLHDEEAIAADIAEGTVYVLVAGGSVVATGTLDGNHIVRVFVSSDRRGGGMGSRMLSHLEAAAAKKYELAVLESSLPAVLFYEHRGYETVSHEELQIDSHGDTSRAVLVYEVMQKALR